MEAMSMIAALAAVLGVVLAKAMVTVRMRLLRRQIGQVDQQKAKILGQLKAMQSTSKVSGANQNSLAKKKQRLQAKVDRARAELAELGSDAERRELQRERTRGKLIRPTRAGSGGEEPDVEGDEGQD